MDAFGDVVRVNSDTGDLIVLPDPSDIWNVTVNVSLACFTEAARGDREWSQFNACFQIIFSIFSLQRVVVQGWPLSVLFPWESRDEVADGSSPAILAMHTETDHVHHEHGGLDTTGASLLFFFIFFGFFALLLSLCATDGYYAYTAPARKPEEYAQARRDADP